MNYFNWRTKSMGVRDSIFVFGVGPVTLVGSVYSVFVGEFKRAGVLLLITGVGVLYYAAPAAWYLVRRRPTEDRHNASKFPWQSD